MSGLEDAVCLSHEHQENQDTDSPSAHTPAHVGHFGRRRENLSVSQQIQYLAFGEARTTPPAAVSRFAEIATPQTHGGAMPGIDGGKPERSEA
ncbi:hypothetical protein Acsp02_94730 [Actinoplanes sp. NBRC 103695]|nr:hypothetical protein Acsp02_94730 [Actinoplanes sp. NBRC 103695]